MNLRARKIRIISISLLLHILVLILLLILYNSPEHEWVYFDTTKTAIATPETVFAETPQTHPEIQQPIPQITQEDNSWAELKPRASTLDASMEMPDETIGVTDEESRSDELVESENDDAQQSEDETSMIRSSRRSSRAISDRYDHSGATHHERESQSESIQNNLAESKENLHLEQPKSSQKTHKISAKKRQAQKALATITRGYLEQLKQEGENLIKTIGGDPNKMPTAEQLKYERYLAKIQWCLQNTHAINRDKCQTHEPIEATMRVYFTLNRAGKMADLKIIQSSGNAFVDRYIRELFEQASSSFPPLPAYIKEDPYQLLYSVLVCWNVANPIYMGLMRE
jgi:TonB family protein